jgi:glycosyltransferase involved in cell wall biosynthesis
MPKTDDDSRLRSHRSSPLSLSASTASTSRPNASHSPQSLNGHAHSASGNARVASKGLTARGSRAHDHRPLIVHSHLRWDFVWQRPQQIFSRLAARHPILFTEEPMFGDGAARVVVTEPHPNVFRAVPVLPAGRHATVDEQWSAVLPLLQDAVRHHPVLARRFDDPVQWFYSPMTAPHFLGRFNARGIVYDCMDELANFRFAPSDIGQRERFLLARADVVFTGGYQLYEAKSAYHDNVHFYGCGVDVAHYGRARLPQTEVPAELASLPGPVFGYFGVIDERIDYDLIDRLACEFPQASIAMVGPVAKVDPASLPSRPNIHWLGQRNYDQLPALVKGFDVCMMPFALNEATRFINPTKTLEYMAAGKPIVSTAVPDVLRNFTPIVEVALEHEAFVDAVAQAHRAPCSELIERGLERASRASWEAIVESMRGHVLDALHALDDADADADADADVAAHADAGDLDDAIGERATIAARPGATVAAGGGLARGAAPLAQAPSVRSGSAAAGR